MLRFEEFVVMGAPHELRAFLAGWAAERFSAKQLSERAFLARDRRVRSETWIESVVEALRPGRVTHLIVREDVVEPIMCALAAVGVSVGIELRERHQVRSASFEFEYAVFSREAGVRVRMVFEALPQGVDLSEDYRPHESVDPKAIGVELYTPAHDYSFEAKGTARGPLAGILELHRRTALHEQIRTGDVVLELEPE